MTACVNVYVPFCVINASANARSWNVLLDVVAGVPSPSSTHRQPTDNDYSSGRGQQGSLLSLGGR